MRPSEFRVVCRDQQSAPLLAQAAQGVSERGAHAQYLGGVKVRVLDQAEQVSKGIRDDTEGILKVVGSGAEPVERYRKAADTKFGQHFRLTFSEVRG